MQYRILVADDEKDIRDLLRLYLEKDDYIVDEAADGLEAAQMLESQEYDLVLLDIMMPGIDGFRLLKKLREDSNIPAMIISAKVTDNDKILGLELGADDYITKPFNPMEVSARVKSNIRRYYSLGSKKVESEELVVRDLCMNTDSCVLTRAGEHIDLTSVEYRIMELFMKNPDKVFTKQQLFEHGWEEEGFFGVENNIMVCISKLRSKLSNDGDEYIQTVRGLGYRLGSK